MSQSQDQKNPKNKLNKDQAIAALWRKGILSWKLDKNQVEMHKLSTETPNKIVVIGCSRQIGKSFFLTTLAIEACLKKPHTVVKFIAPKVKDIKRIIAPLVREITADCPVDLKPSYATQDHIWKFSNGSEIQLAGTDNGHAESIRGNKANLCIIDEAGFCDDLSYIVNSILIPTTTTTGGKIVMASTPPKSLDHDFTQFMKQAQYDGSYIRRTIYDNPRLTENDIEQLASALGGKDSVDFRREYLVELITSEDDAIVPEFNKDIKLEIVRDWERPSHFNTYVSMDIGVRDLTVVLFAYYDFKYAKVIIEDEVVMSGKSLVTDSLASAIINTEKRLWTNHKTGDTNPVDLRVSDNNNLILLNDLQIKHGLTFVPALKDNFDAALNNLRLLIKTKRVIINPRCTTLINHLETGIWNKAKTSFARSSDKGHFDAIHSLVYLLRHINLNKNPYPDHYIGNERNVHFTTPPNQGTNDFEKKLVANLKIRSPRRRGLF